MHTPKFLPAFLFSISLLILSGCSGDSGAGSKQKSSSKPVVADLPNGVKLELLPIKAGTFMMGSPGSEADRDSDENLHQVTITKNYWLGKYLVTQAQWKAVMGSNNPSDFEGDNLPVENVSWNDAQEFIMKLNHMTEGKRPDGYRYMLPTEAQWEYACRAGTITPFSFGETLDEKQANFSGNIKQTSPVGSYPPNAWGLYDMHGNVWEWCADWYDDYPSVGSSRFDQTGPTSGSGRVSRGGSWLYIGRSCRSALRLGFVPDGRGYDLGFRLALVAEK